MNLFNVDGLSPKLHIHGDGEIILLKCIIEMRTKSISTLVSYSNLTAFSARGR
jgi:hypothetical protein